MIAGYLVLGFCFRWSVLSHSTKHLPWPGLEMKLRVLAFLIIIKAINLLVSHDVNAVSGTWLVLEEYYLPYWAVRCEGHTVPTETLKYCLVVPFFYS